MNYPTPRWMAVLALPIVAITLGGCVAAAVGTGVAVGAKVATDRRTTGRLVDDQTIEVTAFNRIASDSELWEQAHVVVTSYNNIALLTGETPTEELRRRAEDIVRQIEGVREVYNELSIAAPSSLGSRTSDSLITARVKAAMLTEDWNVTTRSKVVTQNSVVYLLGLVTDDEAGRATEIARRVGGVQRVVKVFEAYQEAEQAKPAA